MIGYGSVALAVGLLLSSDSIAQQVVKDHRQWLFGGAAAGVVAAVLDYFQYLAGHAVATRAKNTKTPPGPSWASFWARRSFFIVKQIFAISGAVAIGYVLVRLSGIIGA